jgi:GTP cyclohydrolase III
MKYLEPTNAYKSKDGNLHHTEHDALKADYETKRAEIASFFGTLARKHNFDNMLGITEEMTKPETYAKFLTDISQLMILKKQMQDVKPPF